MEAPASTHLKVAKRILSYLKSTIDLGLFYSSSDNFNLVGYYDRDYAVDVFDTKAHRVLCFLGWLCYFLELKETINYYSLDL